MKDICPNCGAAITDEKCPYCGSMFFDFACVDIDKPCYIKFKHKDQITRVKCRFQSLQYEQTMNDGICYADNARVLLHRYPDTTVTMTFSVMPEDNILAIKLDTKKVSKDARPW